MRFLFLNQYFPPDPAPTGVLLRELADDLAARGHTVDFVAARQDYRAGQSSRQRMIRELVALCRMFCDALRRPRADVIVSASSPPCLLVVATLAALFHRAKSVHWVMDLYPEIAVALGEIGDGRVSRVIASIMGWCYRRAAAVVVLDDDMAARVRRYGVESVVIRPWVFASISAKPLPTVAPREPWTWMYSGNLGRAHEWETLLSAQALIEQQDSNATLLFQGGGPSWAKAQARAAELGLKRCEWKTYVPESELPGALLAAQVCVVTELPVVKGCLWPSKLGLVLTLPRAILWVGPTDGAIARELQTFSHVGAFLPGQAGEVADWVLAAKRRADVVPPCARPGAEAHRKAALEAWRTVLDR